MKKNKRIVGSIPLLALCVVALMAASADSSRGAGSLPSQGRVTSVFDGDTILLDTGEKVRYLGIDAPEASHGNEGPDCYAEEAKRANADLVLHRTVTLRYGEEKTDSHGRLLAYVYTPDGRLVNAELLRAGAAFLFRPAGGFDSFREFLDLQRKAVAARLGMWRCPVSPDSSYVGNRRSFVFHRSRCALGADTSTRNRKTFVSRWAALDEGFRPCRRCKP